MYYTMPMNNAETLRKVFKRYVDLHERDVIINATQLFTDIVHTRIFEGVGFIETPSETSSTELTILTVKKPTIQIPSLKHFQGYTEAISRVTEPIPYVRYEEVVGSRIMSTLELIDIYTYDKNFTAKVVFATALD